MDVCFTERNGLFQPELQTVSATYRNAVLRWPCTTYLVLWKINELITVLFNIVVNEYSSGAIMTPITKLEVCVRSSYAGITTSGKFSRVGPCAFSGKAM